MLPTLLLTTLLSVATAQSTAAPPYTGSCLALYESCVSNLGDSPSVSVCIAKANACQSSATLSTSPTATPTAAPPPYTGACLKLFEDCVDGLNGSPAVSVCIAKANACQSGTMTSSPAPTATAGEPPYTGACLKVFQDCYNGLNGSPAVSVCIAKANACQASLTSAPVPRTTVAPPYTGSCLKVFQDCINGLNGSPATSVCVAKANACQSSLTSSPAPTATAAPPYTGSCLTLYKTCYDNLNGPEVSVCIAEANACQASLTSTSTPTPTPLAKVAKAASPPYTGACLTLFQNCIDGLKGPETSVCVAQANACQSSLTQIATTTMLVSATPLPVTGRNATSVFSGTGSVYPAPTVTGLPYTGAASRVSSLGGMLGVVGLGALALL